MSFNPNIPLGPQDMAASQSELNTNFTQLNTVFGVNHVALDAVADGGKHKFCTFPVQAAAPAVTGTEIAIYSATDAVSGTELYAQSSASNFQMTRNDLLFLGAHPHCAVNFTPRDSAGVITAPNGAIDSSYNLTSVTEGTTGKWTIAFPNVTDAAGANTRNYMWTLKGVAKTAQANNVVTVQVVPNDTYNTSVGFGSLEIEARDQAGTLVTMTRVSVIIWKVQ